MTTTKNGQAPTKLAPPPISVDGLTLDEIDQWEVASGLEFSEARRFQQVGAALWVQAALRDGEDISPRDVMRRVTVGALPTLVDAGSVELDPTIPPPPGAAG